MGKSSANFNLALEISIEHLEKAVFIISSKIKGFKIFNDRREIETSLKSFKNKFKKNLTKSYPLILMNKLKEPVYDLDILAWKGKPLRIIPRKRFNSAVPNDGHIIVNDKNCFARLTA